MPNHRKSEADPEVWEQYYDAGKTEWRSSGIGVATRCWLDRHPYLSRQLLEIGCGTGDDSQDVKTLGFDYCGIDISESAISLAREQYPALDFLSCDFFEWSPPHPFNVAYDKGVYHGLGGHERRHEFAEKVASILKPNGHWISVCGAADNRNPNFSHGAIYLTDFVSIVETYFEIREVRKCQYGLFEEQRDFEAWHVLAIRR